MAAPAQTSARREEITFPPNIAVTVSMKYAQPKLVSGRNGGDRYLFTTTDGRIFFCDPPLAQQIEQAGVNTNEPFTITRTESGRKGEAASWRVERIRKAAGEQPDGTFAVPREPEAPAAIAPKPMAQAETSGLVTEANALVDAYAAVLARALDKHQGRVKPDEVRALLISTYIKQTRGAA